MIEIVIISLLLIYGNRQSIAGAVKIKTPFKPVYIDSKPNKQLIKASIKKPGVYLIKVNGQLRYIGYSATNVYKTLTRHFQSWDDPRQTRVTYPKNKNITARIVYTNTGAQAAKLERALILKYQPEDNPNKYAQYQITYKDEDFINDYQTTETEDVPF